jgi:hypothetical protein
MARALLLPPRRSCRLLSVMALKCSKKGFSSSSDPPPEQPAQRPSEVHIELREDGTAITITEVRPWYNFGSVGAVVWPVAHTLVDVLKSASFLPESNAIELGAGTGVIGIALGALTGGSVLLTDKLPPTPHSDAPYGPPKDVSPSGSLLQLCSQNVSLNRSVLGDVKVRPLTWGDDAAIEECLSLTKEGNGFDLVVGSDVTYHSPAHPILFYTAARLLRRDRPTASAPSEGGDAAPLLGLIISHHHRGVVSYESMLRAAHDAGFSEPRRLRTETSDVGATLDVLQFCLDEEGNRPTAIGKGSLPPTPTPGPIVGPGRI